MLPSSELTVDLLGRDVGELAFLSVGLLSPISYLLPVLADLANQLFLNFHRMNIPTRHERLNPPMIRTAMHERAMNKTKVRLIVLLLSSF